MPRNRAFFVPLIVAILATTTTSARAQRRRSEPPPPLNFSEPLAACPGKSTDVTLVGEFSGKPISLWTSFPAESSLIADDHAIRYRIAVAADVPVGIAAMRLFTTTGPANLQLFMIDDLPSSRRQGGSIPAQHPQSITPPVAIDGTCEALAADCFRFQAAKGQRLAIEVVAGRLGSRMDPILRLLDSAGREIAYCDDADGIGPDARFALTIPADGEYLIELRDANYDGGPDYRYRLRVGNFPLLTSTLPLAAHRGSETSVSFCGPGAAAIAPVKLAIPTGPTTRPVSIKPDGADASGFTTILCAEADDILAGSKNLSRDTARPLPLPATVSARFNDPGDRHFYAFDLKKGDILSLRARTRSVGSPADLSLQLLNSKSAPVATSKPATADEGSLDAPILEDGAYVLVVTELARRAGNPFVYHLDARRASPTFSLAVDTDKIDIPADGVVKLKVKCTRHGYDGPIALSLTGATTTIALQHVTIPAGKTDTDVELKFPADASPLDFSLIGSARIFGREVIIPVSTGPAFKRLFPRLLVSPPGVDGLIAAAPAVARASRP